MIHEQANGYTIFKSTTFDNDGGIAIGINKKTAFPLATQQFTEQEDGSKTYFCGYYHTLENAAKLDYDERMEKYKTDNPGIIVKRVTATSNWNT